MRIVSLFASLLLASSGAIAGEDWDFSTLHKSRCSRGGQQQMNACLASEYSVVDAQLNEKYKRLIQVLEDGSSLEKAQVAWLHFRDLTCEYASSGIGRDGSLYSFAQSACLIDLTAKRIRDLDQYLEWNCNGCPPRK
jgi:uncharacterized protein YecT (DUF1311 family)